MADSRELSSAPWQVVFTGAALFLVAGNYATAALNFLLDLSDWGGIKENLADWQGISDRLANATAFDIYHWLAYSAQVFTALAIVFLVLGLLLWRGVLRPGIRLTASLFAWISLIGSVILVSIPDSASAGSGTSHDVLALVINLLASIGCLSLWFGAPKTWVAAG